MPQRDADSYQLWLKKRKSTTIAFVIQNALIGCDFSILFVNLWLYIETVVKPTHPKLFYSLISFSFIVSSGVFSTFICKYADRSRNIRKIFFFTNSTVIIGNIVYMIHFSPWFLALGRVIAGCGLSQRSIIMGELARCYAPQDFTKKVSLMGMIFAFGFMAAPGINAAFQSVEFHIGSWHVTYANISGIYISAFFAIAQIICVFLVYDLSKEYDLKAEMEKSKHSLEEHLQDSFAEPIAEIVFSSSSLTRYKPSNRSISKDNKGFDHDASSTSHDHGSWLCSNTTTSDGKTKENEPCTVNTPIENGHMLDNSTLVKDCDIPGNNAEGAAVDNLPIAEAKPWSSSTVPELNDSNLMKQPEEQESYHDCEIMVAQNSRSYVANLSENSTNVSYTDDTAKTEIKATHKIDMEPESPRNLDSDGMILEPSLNLDNVTAESRSPPEQESSDFSGNSEEAQNITYDLAPSQNAPTNNVLSSTESPNEIHPDTLIDENKNKLDANSSSKTTKQNNEIVNVKVKERAPSILWLTKEMLTHYDTSLLLALSLFENFHIFMSDMICPMIVVDELGWSVGALNAILLGEALCSILPCLLFAIKKFTDRQIFYVSVVSILAYSLMTLFQIIFVKYSRNFILNVCLFVIYCLLFANVMVIKDIFLGGFLVKMVSSKYQSLGDSIRLSVCRLGSLIALITSPFILSEIHIVGWVYIIILLIFGILLVLRRSTLRNPCVLIS